MRNIFLQKSCRKWERETSSRPLSIFKKSLIWSKSKWLAPQFQCFGSPRLGHSIKTNCMNSDPWSRDVFDFDFLKRVWFLHHILCMTFQEENFSCHILLIDQIPAWLSLILKTSGNMCIAVVCYPVCDVINFAFFLSFLNKSFLDMSINLEQKLKNLKGEKSFWGEIKSIFNHF